MLKRHQATPAHLLLDNTLYFITSGIYKKLPLLKESRTKEKLIEIIRDSFREYGWELHHWIVLDNHYHVLGKSGEGKRLPKIMKGIHGSSSRFIRPKGYAEKSVWWNYWDYCPRNIDDF